LNSKEVILDAIEISTDRTEKGFEKALLYGFYNSGDTIKSSALELAKVISEGLQKKMIDEAELYLLRDVINQAQLATDSENLLPKIDCLMVLLNKAKKEEVSVTNTLFIKNLNL
jgi:secreted protein with Ig-like and vWFA domain